jgi:hypothetical protein
LALAGLGGLSLLLFRRSRKGQFRLFSVKPRPWDVRGGVFGKKNPNLKILSAGLSSNMSYTGTVEAGVVKLPPQAALPNGAKVRVELIESPAAERRALVEELRAIAAAMPELPADWAAQHDHYIHGTPKR